MAVHMKRAGGHVPVEDTNKPEDTVSKQTQSSPSKVVGAKTGVDKNPNKGDTIMRNPFDSMFGEGRGTLNDRGVEINTLVTHFNKGLETNHRLASAGVKAVAVVGTAKAITYSYVNVIFSKDGDAAVLSIFFSTDKDIGKYDINTPMGVVEMPRTPSEVQDGVIYDTVVREEVQLLTGVTNVNICKGKVIYPSVQIDQTELAHIYNNVCTAASNELELMANPESDVKVSSLKGYTIAATVSTPSSNTDQVVDENANPISVDMFVDVNYSDSTTPKNSSDPRHVSINSTNVHMPLGTMVLSATPIFNPPTTVEHQNGYNATNRAKLHQFSSHIILETTRFNYSASLYRFFVMLANMKHVLNKKVIKKMYNPATLGALNIHSNLTEEANSNAIDPSEATARYNALFNSLFNDKVNLSVVVAPGDVSYNITHFLYDAATDPDAAELLRTHVRNFIGDPSVKLPDLVSPHVDYYPVGDYPTENDREPLSDVTLLMLMNVAPNQETMLRDWVAASSESDPLIAMAMRKQIISQITSGHCNLIDLKKLVHINPVLISILHKYLSGGGVRMDSNINDFNTPGSTWEPVARSNMHMFDINDF